MVLWKTAPEAKGRKLLTRMVAGRKYSTTTKCHSDADQKPKAVIKAIRRRLKLTASDGVLDKDFYGS